MNRARSAPPNSRQSQENGKDEQRRDEEVASGRLEEPPCRDWANLAVDHKSYRSSLGLPTDTQSKFGTELGSVPSPQARGKIESTWVKNFLVPDLKLLRVIPWERRLSALRRLLVSRPTQGRVKSDTHLGEIFKKAKIIFKKKNRKKTKWRTRSIQC